MDKTPSVLFQSVNFDTIFFLLQSDLKQSIVTLSLKQEAIPLMSSVCSETSASRTCWTIDMWVFFSVRCLSIARG